MEKIITVRRVEEWTEEDPLELELNCSFQIPSMGISFEFNTSSFEQVSLDDMETFASGKSKDIVFEDSNGSCSIKWETDNTSFRFEVSRMFSHTSFTVPSEGIFDEIIPQYKTYLP